MIDFELFLYVVLDREYFYTLAHELLLKGLFIHPLNCLNIFVKKTVDPKCKGLLWDYQFYSIELYVYLYDNLYVYLYHSLYYCSFLVSLKWESMSPSILLFFNIYLIFLGCMCFHMHIRISLSIFTKKTRGILIVVALNL